MVKKNRYYKHPNAIVESKNIGDKTRIWPFSHICKGAYVGKDCNIGECCYVESGVKIGNKVTIKNGVSLWEGVIIEDDVFIGPNAVFTNDLLPRSKKPYKITKTVLKKGATISANATIVCNVTIGKYAMVGAGAVVTKDVSDHELVYGIPAVFKGYVCECGKGLKITKKQSACSCGLKYSFYNKKVIKQI